MAQKTHSKLSLRKETLRQLGASQLGQVVGGLASGIACIGQQETKTQGSTLPSGGSIELPTDQQTGGGSR